MSNPLEVAVLFMYVEFLVELLTDEGVEPSVSFTLHPFNCSWQARLRVGRAFTRSATDISRTAALMQMARLVREEIQLRGGTPPANAIDWS
jgi:hypothetical protein